MSNYFSYLLQPRVILLPSSTIPVQRLEQHVELFHVQVIGILKVLYG